MHAFEPVAQALVQNPSKPPLVGFRIEVQHDLVPFLQQPPEQACAIGRLVVPAFISSRCLVTTVRDRKRHRRITAA